jgi:hypothetical protein
MMIYLMNIKQQHLLSEISDSHGGKYEDDFFLWDVVLCSLKEIGQCFRGACIIRAMLPHFLFCSSTKKFH